MNDKIVKAEKTETSLRISTDSSEKLGVYGQANNLSKKQILDDLVNWLPVFEACKELTIEQAIERLKYSAPTEYLPKTGKNRDKVDHWLEKIFKHNETCPTANRVFITQRLLLNLIGGNVNTISDAYRKKIEYINAHHDSLGINEPDNRKLSHRIRKEHGNLADWLKSVLD